nr:MAG TPA: hypothetical protein [Caudoviricetes sp.]
MYSDYSIIVYYLIIFQYYRDLYLTTNYLH